MSSGNRKPRRSPRGAESSRQPGDTGSASPSGRPPRKWPLIGAAVLLAAMLLAAGTLIFRDQPDSAAPSTAASPGTVSAITAPSPTHVPNPQMPSIVIPPARPSEVTPVASTGPEAGYIGGTQSCAECHAGIVKSYSKVAMGRSISRPSPENTIEDFTTATAYYHEPSRQHFQVIKEGDDYFQERWQEGPQGERINVLRVSIDYVCGSGNHARSYIHMGPEGQAYQLPMAWYPQPSKWAMNPGYDNPVHSGFSRRITYDCAYCHAAYPKIPAGNDKTNFADTSLFTHGLEAIDCERCHGPAAQHVALAKGGAALEEVQKAIVNPGKLDNKLQLDTCMQCHLETTSGKLPHATFVQGKSVYGFRPGEPLENYRIHFDHPKGVGHDDKFEIAGQAYRMRMSKCFTESEGRMTCTTCHDPHKVPVNRVASGNASCMTCHTDTSCKELPAIRMEVKDSCIECHMPRRRTDDVINVVMTDHFIQRFKPDRDLLAPKVEDPRPYEGEVELYYPETLTEDARNLYLGIAHIADRADMKKGVSMLTAYLTRFPESVLALVTRQFAYKELGRVREAIPDLLKALDIDPGRPQTYMALADALERMENYTGAAEAYEQSIKLNPNLFSAWNGLGVNRLLLGNVEGAIEAYRKAAELEEFDEDARLNLASAYGRKGMIGEAAVQARHALAINPVRPTGWVLLAQCMLAEKTTTGPEEAAWYAAQGMRLDPGRPEPFDTLRDAVDAMPPLRQIAAVDSFMKDIPFEAQALKARVLVKREDPEGAVGVLQAMLPSVAGTSYALVLDTAGEAASVSKRHDLAETFYRRSYAVESGNETTLIGLITALSHRDAAGEAEAERLLVSSPALQTSSRLLNTHAFLKATARNASLRNGRQAEELAARAGSMLGRPNVFVLDTVAAAQAEQGRFTEAIATIEKAAAMARADNLPHLVEMLESRLPLYRANRPLRAGEAPLD